MLMAGVPVHTPSRRPRSHPLHGELAKHIVVRCLMPSVLHLHRTWICFLTPNHHLPNSNLSRHRRSNLETELTSRSSSTAPDKATSIKYISSATLKCPWYLLNLSLSAGGKGRDETTDTTTEVRRAGMAALKIDEDVLDGSSSHSYQLAEDELGSDSN